MGRLTTLLAALLTLAALPAAAQTPYYDELRGTTHDFSLRGGGEICLGCHVNPPDTAADDFLVASPLWGGGWNSGLFPVGQAAADDWSDTSDACLECHDGGLAGAVHQQRDEVVTRERGGSRSPDHPIRIPYPRAVSGKFVVPTPLPQHLQYWSVPDMKGEQLILPHGPTSSYQTLVDVDSATFNAVRTRDGKVHCESCHNPHSNKAAPYLRAMPPDLCLVCHEK
ncbi:MAG: cytochrome c3 family protein [Nitrospirota bacterium]|nr:cytochrome c3 family protein [Nitrospirota bacterium]